MAFTGSHILQPSKQPDGQHSINRSRLIKFSSFCFLFIVAILFFRTASVVRFQGRISPKFGHFFKHYRTPSDPTLSLPTAGWLLVIYNGLLWAGRVGGWKDAWRMWCFQALCAWTREKHTVGERAAHCKKKRHSQFNSRLALELLLLWLLLMLLWTVINFISAV